MRKFPSLSALRAFEASSRLGSHRKAAKELCLDHTVISKHIRNLEEDLGVSLLDATPAGTSLTPAGSDYYQKIAGALEVIAAATNEIRQRGPYSALHVACSPGFAVRWLTPRLIHFLEQNPGIEIALRPTIRTPNLVARDADIDIRYMEPDEQETTHTVLGRPRVFPVASPQWVQSHSAIVQLEDLLVASLVHEETHEYWQLWLNRAGVPIDEMPRGPRYWSAALAIDAAKMGHGVALANDWIAADEIEAGELVEVLATNVVLHPYVFITRADRWNDPAIACFRDWLIEAVKNWQG